MCMAPEMSLVASLHWVSSVVPQPLLWPLGAFLVAPGFSLRPNLPLSPPSSLSSLHPKHRIRFPLPGLLCLFRPTTGLLTTVAGGDTIYEMGTQVS